MKKEKNKIKIVSSMWLSRQFDKGTKKWDTLRHNGVVFPPNYVPHQTPLIYNNEKITLNPLAEEYATMYVKYLDSDYAKNRTFRHNFWIDWIDIVSDDRINNYDDCDFSLIKDYSIRQKEEKKLVDPALKLIEKQKEEKYKIAFVDDNPQPVGNFKIEPPGIFLGRGNNPKIGKIKKRIYPEDIILNIDNNSPIPEIPEHLIDHHWGQIIHNQYVEWLASWKDNITGKIKYVWLGNASDIKGKKDNNKFDLARKLKRKIKYIRDKNQQNLFIDDEHIRQIATALYFIDNLALRVGNEKGDDETDTVGVTSLRIEHLILVEPNELTLDFLGKDSIRYHKTIAIDDQVFKNIREFIMGKQKGDNVFDKINSTDVNKYLQGFMKDLTAKVFRTYNASWLFQKELDKINVKYSDYNESNKTDLLLDEFNRANIKVAKLCNHQKGTTSTSHKQIDNINAKIRKTREQLKKARQSNKKNPDKIKKLKIKIESLKSKKQIKTELKNISLSTSKINYIDPRITVSFFKKHNLDIDKIFSKTLKEKFKWAFNVDENYQF